MIEPIALKSTETTPLTVLYHSGCWDGFCSAWIAWRRFGDYAKYIAVRYEEPPPELPQGGNVYILDFSYPREQLDAIADQSKFLCILDHHKTAEEPLKLFAEGQPNKVHVEFDLNKSGARLTWEYFHGSQGAPWLVAYTEDRDLWRWRLPKSKEINAALRSYPLKFQVWDEIFTSFLSPEAYPERHHFAIEGSAILRAENEVVMQHVRHAGEIEMDGHKILAVNATVQQSEIAGKLAKGRPFGAVYFITKDGKRVWSLRSREGGIDVSAIAKAHGGGGHEKAAGFTEPAEYYP